MRLAATFLALALAAGRAAGGEDALAAVKHALKRGDVPQAVTLAERAAAESPGSSEAHHWLGKAYGLKAKDAALATQISLAKKCRAELERAVELDPANLGAALDLVRYDARAPRFLGGGKERARALAAEIGTRSPARGRVALGIVAELEKKPAGAERAYRDALALDPTDGEALSALVDLLASSARWDEAFEVCRAAAERAPDEPHAWFEIGLLSARSGRETVRGIAALDRFLELPPHADGPDASDARFRRGELLALQGDDEGARAELTRALMLEPGHAGAGQALARLTLKKRPAESAGARRPHRPPR